MAPNPHISAKLAEPELQPGDLVRLNSCQKWMTVIELDCIEVKCAWFNGSDLCKQRFHQSCITRHSELPF